MQGKEERKDDVTLQETIANQEEQQVDENVVEETQTDRHYNLPIAVVVLVTVAAILLIAIALIILVRNGDNKEKQQVSIMQVEEQPTEVVQKEEQTVETAQKVEETVVNETTKEVKEEQAEQPAENLSNEEWVKSLNLDTVTFVVFNDTTGERKILEEGQEYKLLEGDELAFWYPVGWESAGDNKLISYSIEFKYDSMICTIKDSTLENVEFTQKVRDKTGKVHSATIYVSK